MILTEAGIRFTHEGNHWRCVEYPDLLMLRGERYCVGDREFTTLGEAVRHLSGAAAVSSSAGDSASWEKRCSRNSGHNTFGRFSPS
jgi:hypothetical protein